MGKSYQEKLTDPRWQKKRLEILERDGWRCVLCGAKDKTLHVHHFEYKSGGDPWDVDNSSLRTFCDDCHKFAHAFGSAAEFRESMMLFISSLRPENGDDVIIRYILAEVDKCEIEYPLGTLLWAMRMPGVMRLLHAMESQVAACVLLRKERK